MAFDYEIKKVYLQYIKDLEDILKLMQDLIERKQISATYSKLVWAATIDEEFKLLVDALTAAKDHFVYDLITVFKNHNKDIVTDLDMVRKEISTLENSLKGKIQEIKTTAKGLTERYGEFNIFQQLDFSNFVMAINYEDILSECRKKAKTHLKNPTVEAQKKLRAHLDVT